MIISGAIIMFIWAISISIDRAKSMTASGRPILIIVAVSMQIGGGDVAGKMREITAEEKDHPIPPVEDQTRLITIQISE